MTVATEAKLRAEALIAVLERHKRKADLIKAGKLVDSLLRALIPLYVVRGVPLQVTSGGTQRMWKKYGVKVQATVMAKALREHIGYARRTRNGIEITPNGVKYVENGMKAALER